MARVFGGAINNRFEYTSYQENVTEPAPPPTFAEVPTARPSPAAGRGRSSRPGHNFRVAGVSRTIFPVRLLLAPHKLGRYVLLISYTDINVKYEY
jgi:hypothetical protein